MTWLRRLLRRNELDCDLDRELADHLERRTADLVARGVEGQEARRLARVELGAIDQVKEECREARGTAWVHDLVQDIRYSARVLRRNPGFAATAVVCLALGIGVNTTIFSWLDEMYFRRLPVPEADRVVLLKRGSGPSWAYRDFIEAREQIRALTSLSAIIPKETFLDVDRVNDQIYVEVVSANYFETLMVHPRAGRSFQPSDDSPSSEPVVILSDTGWRRHFQGDSEAIGKRVRIEDQWYRIVGIAPHGFRGTSAPLAIDGWVPLATYPHFRADLARSGSAPGPLVSVIGRLSRDHSLREAQAEIKAADSRIGQRLPAAKRTRAGIQVHSVAGYAWSETRRRMQPIAVLLGAVVAAILLIACVNVASLLLARSAARQREAGLRRALGAGRGRLLRQGMTEGLLLALGGAVLGLGLGLAANRAIGAALPSAHPDLAQQLLYLSVNWRVAGFTALTSLICAVLFSISPALANARADMTPVLKSVGGPPSGGGYGLLGRWSQRDLFVVLQVALSLVLLISATLLIRALGSVQQTDPGFATVNRTYIRLFAPENDFTFNAARTLFGRLIEEAGQIPGVRDVTMSFAVFGFMDGDCASGSASSEPRKLNINVVEPNYFRFLEIPILRGRTFSPADREGSPRVIVVNETMARRWWPGEDPIGKTAWLGCKEGPARFPAEVIGVVRDSKYGTLDEEARPFYFVHWRQVWWNGFFALMVHTSGRPAETADRLLALARTGGPNLRIYEVRSLQESLALSLFQAKCQAILLGACSLLAIALASVGLYGVIAFAVTQRTREIGVRMALGARAHDVRRMIFTHTLRLTGLGICCGLVSSTAVTQLLRRFLFGLSPFDGAAFVLPAVFWLLIGLVASYAPARRATSVSPVIALRHD